MSRERMLERNASLEPKRPKECTLYARDLDFLAAVYETYIACDGASFPELSSDSEQRIYRIERMHLGPLIDALGQRCTQDSAFALDHQYRIEDGEGKRILSCDFELPKVCSFAPLE